MIAEKIYYCSGDAGDVIYTLSCIKVLGGGHVRLTPSVSLVRASYTPSKAESEARLIRCQPYILSCEYCTREERDEMLKRGSGVNVDGFRRQYKGGPNIIDWISDYLGLGKLRYDPWLTVPNPTPIAPVVIHRSPRYQTPFFPWWDVLTRFAGRVIMVGLPEEHRDFCARYGPVPYHPTQDFLELAQVIAGSQLFIGNQSAPMAVALGLGTTLVQEVDPGTANCCFWGRSNAQFIRHRNEEIHWPEDLDLVTA